MRQMANSWHKLLLHVLVSYPGWVAGDASLCPNFDPSKLDKGNPKDYCRFQIDDKHPPKEGDMCLAHPEDLLPTQAAFGEVDANCEREGIEKKAAKGAKTLNQYLMDKPVPGVLSPGGKVYITDHHHLSSALLRSYLPFDEPKPHRALYVCIGYDLSSLDVDSFWAKMERDQLVYLVDERGRNLSVSNLPTSVKYLRDDPYRTLALWIRNSYGFVKCGQGRTSKIFPQCSGGKVAKPFIEFRWANEFRKKFSPPNIFTESDQEQVKAFKGILKDVMAFALSKNCSWLEGWNQMKPQYTDLMELDDRGCAIDKSNSYVVV
eukprot:TRINITY_DN56860_c0_g1_i1.p1 TRINITY_DN56860_c0_g1~~TRINITY_DN56860_c0_g1_i1.p1  ORF type:complete len:319 (-),score=38.62 TRINITY_DN56860_c0_g1_i1:165-1121(-)